MKKEIEKLFYFPRIQQYSHPSGTVGKEKKKRYLVQETRGQHSAKLGIWEDTTLIIWSPKIKN